MPSPVQRKLLCGSECPCRRLLVLRLRSPKAVFRPFLNKNHSYPLRLVCQGEIFASDSGTHKHVICLRISNGLTAALPQPNWRIRSASPSASRGRTHAFCIAAAASRGGRPHGDPRTPPGILTAIPSQRGNPGTYICGISFLKFLIYNGQQPLRHG